MDSYTNNYAEQKQKQSIKEQLITIKQDARYYMDASNVVCDRADLHDQKRVTEEFKEELCALIDYLMQMQIEELFKTLGL